MKLVRQLLVVSLFSSSLLLAQTPTGGISGLVQDESGAVIPNASVTVTNVETGIARSLQTDSAGRYHVAGLIVGNYQIQAQTAGFETSIRKGIQLTVGAELEINLSLKVGQVEQQTVVTAEAPLVETTTSAMSALVDDKTVRDLPLNGRSFDQLISLESSTPTIRQRGSTTLTGAGDVFSVNGARTQSNMYLMDGTELVGAGSATSLPGGVLGKNMGVDAVQEFSVLSSNYSAAYGKRAGGVINIATRSGTNDFHGSAFEFLRNSALDTRQFFDATSNAPFRRNQFGGAIGGPIRKDKTFFFGNFEGLREGVGLASLAIVPDANARQGILPGQAQITVSPLVKPYLDALYPLPNDGKSFNDGTGEFRSSPTKVDSQNYFLTRIDHTISDKDSIFGRFNSEWASLYSPDQIPLFAENDSSHDQVFTLEEKRVSPKAMNVARFGFTRARTFTTDNPATGVDLDPTLRFLPNVNIVGQLTFSSSSTGGTITPSGSSQSVDRHFVVNYFDYADQVFLYRGPHSFQFGVQVQRLQHNENFQNNERGTFQFKDLASFLQAKATLFRAPSPPSANVSGDATKAYRQIFFAGYIQDDYKVRNNLTLNLGLRYELMTVPVEESGDRISNFRPVTINGVIGVETLPTLGGPSPLCTACPIGSFFQGNHDAFAPRVGFAWDVKGDGKTAVRGGFGMFYDQIENEFRFFTANNSPFFGLSQVSSPPFPLGFSQSNGSVPTPAPDGLSYNFRVPTRVTWGLSVQRQLAANSLLSVGYSGSGAYHLTRNTDDNSTPPIFGPNGTVTYPLGTQPRINPALGNSRIISSDSNSSYNSLQVDYTQRMSHGMRAKFSYTFAKSLDDTSVIISQHAIGNSSSVQNPFNFKADKGPSAFDLRNNFVSNFTYDLPKKEGPGVVGKVAGGWQIGGIFTLQNGTPFTILDGVNWSNDQARSISDRPNLVSGGHSNPVLGGADHYFDASQFVLPTQGTYGNLGRDTMVGPGFIGTDLSLTKTTAITERLKSEFRIEAFDFINHANFSLPNNLIFTAKDAAGNPTLSGSAGVIQAVIASYPNRQIQFGLKLLF